MTGLYRKRRGEGKGCPLIRLLENRARDSLLDLLVWSLYHDALRKPLLGILERSLFPPGRGLSGRLADERRLMLRAVLRTVDRLVRQRLLAPAVLRRSLGQWARVLWAQQSPDGPSARFEQVHGQEPPWFLMIGPGQTCNLHCPGCYASSGPSRTLLPYPVLERILREAQALWGVPLFVFSGGEPFACHWGERSLLDLVESIPDSLTLVFTNGTLIDKEVARRMARIGTITPAFSIEGLRERTDGQRGVGTFDRVLEAMASLRQAGVPFGISATLTRDNCDEILSDDFLDFFFLEQGAFYGFLFHYMPIGRAPDLERMPTPEQRLAAWRKTWEWIERKGLFLFDFWNHGPLAEGCLAAGRPGGYLYIDWNGKVMPCVFTPYAPVNIGEIYAHGGTLQDAWEAPFFVALRAWQAKYREGKGEPGNWLAPCPIRDHYQDFLELVQAHHPEPEDPAAAQAAVDPEYAASLCAYGETWSSLSRETWRSVYLRR
jgi:MoaA/NifB/PqqE/SkfB family radical SAM enzyme